MLCEGLARASADYLVALNTAGSIVWAEPELLGALGRMPCAGEWLHLDQFLAGDDLTAVSRGMGQLFSDRPEGIGRGLRVLAAGGSPIAHVVGAWRLDFKDGASLVMGFVRLDFEPGPAS